MKTVADYVLVRVASELNDFLGVIKDENGKDVKLVINPNWQPTRHARICGEVIAVPEYLSGMDSPLYEHYPGSPKPTVYRGHDAINRQMEMTPPKYRTTTKIPYVCGRYTPQHQTHFGTPVETKVKDVVYFHYLSLLREENFLYREKEGSLVYRIHYSQIFCFVRDGEMTMLNAFVLVVPYYEESSQKIDVAGQQITGKMKGDLVVELGDKPRYLTGMVCHIGEGIGPDKRTTIPGTLILFRPSSEFRNVIEGCDFYVMKHFDILCEFLSDAEIEHTKQLAARENIIIEFNKVIAVGDYVMIQPDDQPVSKSLVTHVYDPAATFQRFDKGDIFIPAGVLSQEKKKKFHRYGIGTVVLQGELCKKNFVGRKVAFEKSAYYLWCDEFKIVFVRYGDIYGTLDEQPANSAGAGGPVR